MLPGGAIYQRVLDLPAYISLAATIACILLVVLYVSQRRDIQRLRAWMEVAPGHPASDLAASEAMLDRAETELEALLGTLEPAETGARQEGASRTGATSTAQRQPTTGERPALEQITMERDALLPHPRWRRIVKRVGQPRVLGIIALAAVVLGLLAIFGSERLLRGGEGSHAARVSDVTVGVLNGTSDSHLATRVGDDVQANEFKLGAIRDAPKPYQQTVVMYQPHQRRAASRVANDLGVKPVQPIDRQTQRRAGGADVVVIAGADRAKQ